MTHGRSSLEACGLQVDVPVSLIGNLGKLNGIVNPAGVEFLSRLHVGTVILYRHGNRDYGFAQACTISKPATLTLSRGTEQEYLMVGIPLSNGGELNFRLNEIPIWGASRFEQRGYNLVGIPHGAGYQIIVRANGKFFLGRMRAFVRECLEWCGWR